MLGCYSWGFEGLKDVLDVLVVPLAIFVFGFWLARLIENQKRDSFFSLIRRELEEMVPRPLERLENGRWPEHLTKRFIHEDIFRQPSQNRDFILSLPPDVAIQRSATLDPLRQSQAIVEIFGSRGARCELVRLSRWDLPILR